MHAFVLRVHSRVSGCTAALSSAVPVHTTVDTCHNLDLCGVRQIIIYVQAFKARDTARTRGEGGWTHDAPRERAIPVQRARERTDRMNIGAHRQLNCGRPTLTNRPRNAVESDELLQAPKNGLTHRHPQRPHKRKRIPPVGTPQNGIDVNAACTWLRGAAQHQLYLIRQQPGGHISYTFATGCPFCAGQRLFCAQTPC